MNSGNRPSILELPETPPGLPAAARALEEAAWAVVCAARARAGAGAAPPWRLDLAGTPVEVAGDGAWSTPSRPIEAVSRLFDLYLPLAAAQARPFVVAHLGQSLDGRIAAANGNSRWVTGPADLLHSHRMRALADAVVVGAGTVRSDDPQLTVRHCPGPSPVRVVIDPDLRLPEACGIFRDGAGPTLVVAAEDRLPPARRWGAEVLAVPRRRGQLDCARLLEALAGRGLGWIFVEGGGITVSRFLAERALDRLQMTISPLIIGSGRPVIVLPEIDDLAQALRPKVRRFPLGEDLMIECLLK